MSAVAPKSPLESQHNQVIRQSTWKKILKRPETGALGGTILIFIFFYTIAPPFRSMAALGTVLYQSAVLGIPSVGVSLLMIGGEFDLTAGVAVTTSSLAAALFATQAFPNLWIGVLLALVVSLTVGVINGLLLTKTKLHSFLLTLSTFLMLEGGNIALTRVITGGNVATQSVGQLPDFRILHAIFASNFMIDGMDLSILVFYWIGLMLIATWVLLRTRIGNWIFAVGGQGESARAVGVPVKWVKIGLYMFVGLCVWFLGMHLLFSYHTVQSGAGVGNALLYIAASVVGGCLLTGGYGSAVGSALGAFIFGMTSEGVIYAGWPTDWFLVFIGAMLLFATVFNNWLRLRASKGR